MPSWINEIAIGVISAVFIAALTSYITVRLSIRRFHEEKWWEKKVEIYSRLLTTLHLMKNHADKLYKDLINVHNIGEEEGEELYQDWKKFSREFTELKDLASFYLSNETVGILEEYENRQAEALAEPRQQNSWPTSFKTELDNVSDCFEKLKQAAKKDLKVK